MKKIIICCLLTIFTISVPAAAKKLPKGAYFWSDFETAKKDAIKKQKAFVIYANEPQIYLRTVY